MGDISKQIEMPVTNGFVAWFHLALNYLPTPVIQKGLSKYPVHTLADFYFHAEGENHSRERIEMREVPHYHR